MVTAVEIPSDQDVIASLNSLGTRVSAAELCEDLVSKGFPKQKSQLAIQRAVDRGRINLDHDWMLTVRQEELAA